MTQFGFYFDQSRCFSCRTCSVACRDWNDISPGPVKYLRVFRWEKGAFPNTQLHALVVMCYHCQNPVCVDAANGAMYKEEKYGAVLIDPDKATSIDLRKANEVCPYGTIAFESDSINAKASKCNMCIDRLEQGLKPVCVMSCPTRALDFGPIDELMNKYGTLKQLEDMPSADLTKPAVVFKPRNAKKKLVPYDEAKALQLLSKRDPLPPVMQDPSSVNDLSAVATGKLVLKPANVKEAMLSTKDDMG